jgi:hypothetical protein
VLGLGIKNEYSGYYQKTGMFIDKNIKKTAKIENRAPNWGIVTIENTNNAQEPHRFSRTRSWCAMIKTDIRP